MATVKNEDLPERMKKRQEIAHSVARQSVEQVWNVSLEAIMTIKTETSGNDALSYFGTIISDFAARWIYMMDKIAKIDDAGIETEELVKCVINGILASISCEAEFVDEKKELPYGIKRLKAIENEGEQK